MTNPIPARAIWALGISQIIGYGTLYYAFSILAPGIGTSFGWSPEWVFGALTVALLIGGLASPASGYLVDRWGAGRAMTLGSLAAGLALVLMALSPNGYVFALALILMEVTSTLVLYAAAFAALVQLGGRGAQASITHLTLIAGFASTLFWPLTAALLSHLDWRSIYLVFAGLNVVVCAPLHLYLGRLGDGGDAVETRPAAIDTSMTAGALPPDRRRLAFALVLVGFALEGLVLAAVLLQVAPLLTALGLGGSMMLVTSVFGPAQVLSRLANMVLGKELAPTALAALAAVLLPAGIGLLALTAPSLIGAVAFALLFGLGSGLVSVVSGSLPLQLFGQQGYGMRQGWLSSARQIAAALAPFAMAVVMGFAGVPAALWVAVAIGVVPIAVFLVLFGMTRQSLPEAAARPA